MSTASVFISHTIASFEEYAYLIEKNQETNLKRVEKVEENPGNDDVVVQGNEEGDGAGGDADASQPGVDGVPHPQRAEPHLLANAQLYQKQRDPLQNQHEQERDQKGTWNIRH